MKDNRRRASLFGPTVKLPTIPPPEQPRRQRTQHRRDTQGDPESRALPRWLIGLIVAAVIVMILSCSSMALMTTCASRGGAVHGLSCQTAVSH